MKNPVITLITNNINDIVPMLFNHPVIAAYINRFNPMGDKVIKNECYSIEYENLDAVNQGKKSRISVYLNQAIQA